MSYCCNAEQSMYHSERLALAFAIHKQRDGVVRYRKIIITKNLRMCEKCHATFSAFSKIYSQYDFVVRDTHRFHVFKDGKCSCNNYY